MELLSDRLLRQSIRSTKKCLSWKRRLANCTGQVGFHFSVVHSVHTSRRIKQRMSHHVNRVSSASAVLQMRSYAPADCCAKNDFAPVTPVTNSHQFSAQNFGSKLGRRVQLSHMALPVLCSLNRCALGATRTGNHSSSCHCGQISLLWNSCRPFVRSLHCPDPPWLTSEVTQPMAVALMIQPAKKQESHRAGAVPQW